MRVPGEMVVGDRTLPVEVHADGGRLSVLLPSRDKSLCFEGQPEVFWYNRVANRVRLMMRRSSPMRCLLTAVRLLRDGDHLMLIIDPGSPWRKPILIRIAQQAHDILDEWNRVALKRLYGHCVRCEVFEDGFTISDTASGSQRGVVRWSDVQAILAFKRDLFTYDMICLAFQLMDDDWVEIWEESDGFMGVNERMKQVFPGIPDRWYSEIMLPTFAPMDTLLYRRDLGSMINSGDNRLECGSETSGSAKDRPPTDGPDSQ